MSQVKEYYAFISYKREDEKWAKWLQNKLENYKLPTSLINDSNLPREIRPVFRDKSELSGGVLSDAINNELGLSKFLIVVCSPNAARSVWVGKEVQAFIDLGRAGFIIPFIVDGKPYASDPKEECFPQTLLRLPPDQELLGINIDDSGREAAVVKVIAQMFGLKFDSLWRRHERAQKIRRMAIITGAMLFAIISLIIGSYIARKNVELDRLNQNLEKANKMVIRERDRAEATSDSLMIANSEISRRDSLILQQNSQLIRERDKVLRANWKMLENQSKAVAEEAIKLAEEGDYFMARRLAAAALPNRMDRLADRPYVPQVEYALWKAWEKDGCVLHGHEDWVNCVAFSPDGKIIASGSNDATIRIWDMQTGTQIGDPIESGSNVKNLVFNYDGSVIAAYHDAFRPLVLYDVKTRQKLGELSGFPKIGAMAFSPNSNILLTGNERGEISVWNIDSLQQKGKTVKGHSDSITNLAFSPDGKSVASCGSNKQIDLWESESMRNLGVVFEITSEMENNVVDLMYFSPDAREIVSYQNNRSYRTLYAWDVKTGKITRGPVRGDFSGYPIAISPDKKTIASISDSEDGVLQLRYAQTMVLRPESRQVSSLPVNCVLFSPDGKSIASGSWDKTVRLTAVNATERNEVNTPLVKAECYIANSIAVFPGERVIAAGCGDGRVHFFDSSNGESVGEPLIGHADYVNSISLSPDGTVLASASNDKTIRFWSVKTRKQLGNAISVDYVPHAIAFSPDGTMLAYEIFGTINLLDVNTRKPMREPMKGHKMHVTSIVFSRDGKRIISSSDDKTVRLWDLKSRRQIGDALIGHQRAINDVSISPDGKTLVSGGWDNTVRLWDIGDGKQIRNHKDSHLFPVYAVAFSPNGNIIASGSVDGTICIWDVKSGTIVHAWDGGPSVNDFAFINGGKRLVVGTSSGIEIWNIDLRLLLDKTRSLFPPLSSKERSLFYFE